MANKTTFFNLFKLPQNRWFLGLFFKTTEPNELKFRVELDFSHMVAQKKFQVIQTKSP